jgi:hypothetical protein
MRRATIVVVAGMLAWSARPASAQQSISDVLSFLMTNRSIVTDDFARDEQAAAATRDTISRSLQLDLATLPRPTSAGGFTYRLDPALGTVLRSSESFGPFYTERSLTTGANRGSFGLSLRRAKFDQIDGRNLRDGTLVSTASTLRGDTTPFDVETIALRIRTETLTASGNYGVTDRLDVSALVPIVRVTLEGERVDTYRGRRLVQATGSGSAAGLGDVSFEAKYNAYRAGASGVSVGAIATLPTGKTENLLGTGEATLTPMVMGSAESGRLAVHGDLGYSWSESSNGVSYAAAVTVATSSRFMLAGEISGLRLWDLGQLTTTTAPNPRLVGVDTIRLTSVSGTANRIMVAGGFKWNIANTLLLNAAVLHPLTDTGLTARWVPTITLEYSLGE